MEISIGTYSITEGFKWDYDGLLDYAVIRSKRFGARRYSCSQPWRAKELLRVSPRDSDGEYMVTRWSIMLITLIYGSNLGELG